MAELEDRGDALLGLNDVFWVRLAIQPERLESSKALQRDHKDVLKVLTDHIAAVNTFLFFLHQSCEDLLERHDHNLGELEVKLIRKFGFGAVDKVIQ